MRLILKGNEAHLWQAVLTAGRTHTQSLWELLSQDERARADRLHFARHRDGFIVSHAFLRTILGGYLGVEPQQLEFCLGPHGKPALAREAGGDSLRFSLAHSHELAVLAVARGREIGVDTEYIHPNPPCTQVAQQFFSPEEAAALDALPPRAQPRAFYTYWTRKEAYLKARGDGLAFPLDQVQVSPPDEAARLLSVDGDPAEAARWSLYDLAPAAGYVGALAVEGMPLRLRQCRWPEG